EHHS
ncbi:HAMP domain protein, partial [Vibrio harveyi]